MVSRLMLCLLCLSAGCRSLVPAPATKAEEAEFLGRAAVVAYMLKKDKLDEDEVLRVKQVWRVFDEVMSGDIAAEDWVADKLKGRFDKRIGELSDPALVPVFNHYWQYLLRNVDLKDKLPDDVREVLVGFHRGIVSAMDDYKL